MVNINLNKIEELIVHMTQGAFAEKYNLSFKLSDIPEIPDDSFEKLQEGLNKGEIVMRLAPLSISGQVFNMVSTPTERKLFSLCSYMIMLGPLAGIVLGYIYSWYWLILSVVSFVFFSKLSKVIYSHAMFDRAFNSEIIACFLFTSGKITLEYPKEGILYR